MVYILRKSPGHPGGTPLHAPEGEKFSAGEMATNREQSFYRDPRTGIPYIAKYGELYDWYDVYIYISIIPYMYI